MKPDLIIFGGTALTMNGQMAEFPSPVIEVSGGTIASIRSEPGYVAPEGTNSLDCRGCLVLPGFINGHTHTGMTLLRGVADDISLMRWLKDRIFPLEQRWGKPDFIYLGTCLASLEMIRSGTTTFNDMYYFEEHAAKAAHEAGLRAICGQTVIEVSGVDNPTKNISSAFERYFEALAPYPRITPAVAPHSVYGVSDPVMKEVIRFAKSLNVSLHVHVAEVMDEVDECQKRFGMSPVEKMRELGMLELPVVAAHATCVSDNDIAILAAHSVGIITNPESNLKLGAKICPITQYRSRGMSVGIGTDSTASNNNLDMITEGSSAAKLQCYQSGPGALDVRSTLKMLTIEGARALGISDRVGSLEPGKCADIIAVGIDSPHCVPLYDPYSHLVYSANGADVRHTVVDGHVLMRDRQILSLNESDILNQAREFGRRILPSGLHPEFRSRLAAD